MTKENTEKKSKIGYAVGAVADVGNGRQLNINFNMDEDADAATMNAKVDLVMSILNRQQAKAASMGATDEIGQLELRITCAKEDLARLDEQGKDKGGLSAQQRQNRESAVAHIDKMEKDLEFKQGILKRLKEEAK